MRRARIELLALAAALLIPAAGGAQEPRPTPQIPAEFRAIVTALSPDRLEVRGLNGVPIPVDITYYEPADFRLLADGRYLGLSLSGYEADGYLLVDRAAAGAAAILETGELPTFSPGGRYFAAAVLTEAGWNNLEGIALWEVRPDRTIRRFFTNAVPFSHHWRVDRWVAPNCAQISAVGPDWQPPEAAAGDADSWEAAVAAAPRAHYGLEAGDGIAFRATFDRPACSGDERGGNDG